MIGSPKHERVVDSYRLENEPTIVRIPLEIALPPSFRCGYETFIESARSMSSQKSMFRSASISCPVLDAYYGAPSVLESLGTIYKTFSYRHGWFLTLLSRSTR
uniref:Uncharacterized protein n=1 Tax=Compsopogon caeruleus TaxID=31354 RepID=A0A7S1TEX2_9RHOD